MPNRRLTAFEYRPEHAVECEDFDCGDEHQYEIDVASWIKGEKVDDSPDLAESLAQGTKVWIYKSDAGELVGYASLGTTRWKWPPPNGSPQEMTIIPWFGVQKVFQHEPAGAERKDRYAHQILGHVICRARDIGNEFLVLFVDDENTRAINFYENAGFETIDSRHGFTRMILNLR